jgi:hypothetical protein
MFQRLFLQSFLLMICVTQLMGCHWGSHSEKESLEEREITDFPQEIKLPSVMWDLLEQKKLIDAKGKIVANPEISTKFEQNVFVGMVVHLREKTPGILGGKNYELKAMKSGMSLDLAHYIKMDKGTFIISFEPAYTLDSKTAQVLFLNQSIKRELAHQVLGGGCGKFYDITKAYLKDLRQGGIEVNVTDGRHVSLLAGTFFIRVSHETGVRALTQLTITDSNHPELLCDGTAGVDE